MHLLAAWLFLCSSGLSKKRGNERKGFDQKYYFAVFLPFALGQF